MRWNIYEGKKLIAKASSASMALSIATSGMVSAFPIYIKKEGRIALKLTSYEEQSKAGCNYERTMTEMYVALRDAAQKSIAAYEKKWPRTTP